MCTAGKRTHKRVEESVADRGNIMIFLKGVGEIYSGNKNVIALHQHQNFRKSRYISEFFKKSGR